MAIVRLPTFLLGFLTMSTALGACLDAGSSLDATVPSWSSGYVYSFTEGGSYSVKSSGSGPEGGGSRDEHEKFGPMEVRYEVLNTSFEDLSGEAAYLLAFDRRDPKDSQEAVQARAGPADDDMIAIPIRQTVVLAALRQRDLQDVPVTWNLDQDCADRVCRLVLDRITVGRGASWTFLDFPLKTGKDWSATMQEGDGDFEGIRMRMHAEVDGKAKARTPLGSLSAIRVNYDFTPENLDEVKDQIRKDAQEEGVEIRSLDIRIKVHLKVYYSPVYQTIVRLERTFDQAFKVSGRQDGQDFSIATENRVEFVRELTGARLVTYPERDLAGIGRVLLGDNPLGDPNGEAFRPVGYTVQVDADRESVNAALAEGANFTAVLKGVQSLPQGHTARWSVVDPFGKTVDGQEGMQFSFQPKEPGQYMIEVQTRDANGNITSAAAQPLAANFVTTKRVQCPQLAASPLLRDTCDVMLVPVRPGIRSLTVAARLDGTFADTGSGELRLTDAAGVVVRDTSRMDNAYSIRLGEDTAFNLRGISSTDWSLVYAPSRAIQESTEYSVELLYDEPVPKLPVGSAQSFVDRMQSMFLRQMPPGEAYEQSTPFAAWRMT